MALWPAMLVNHWPGLAHMILMACRGSQHAYAGEIKIIWKTIEWIQTNSTWSIRKHFIANYHFSQCILRCQLYQPVSQFSHSVVSDSLQPHGLVHGFFISWATREAQEHWSVWPVPFPVDLSDAGIQPESPTLQANSLPGEQPGIFPW